MPKATAYLDYVRILSYNHFCNMFLCLIFL
jgi:hypothetical protein